MDACTLDQLESYSDQLAATVKGLRTSLHTLDPPEVNSYVVKDAAKAKATILASVEGIRTLLDEPDEFLQRLTTQVRNPRFRILLPSASRDLHSGFIDISCRWRFLRASNGSLNFRFWRAFLRK
jgi:hypothetical protein